MEVICIDNGTIATTDMCYGDRSSSLTLYKKYKVLFESNDFYSILNDNGETEGYTTERFVTIKQYRKLKLEQIDGSNLHR